MHEGWRVGLLAVLLVFAGCGGSAGSGAETTTLTPVEPAEVTAGESTPQPLILPGLGRESVVDPAAVARTHERTLRNASFWFTYNRTVVAANGTRLERESLGGNVAPDAETYRLTLVRGTGAATNRTTYVANESAATGLPPVDPYFQDRIATVLASFQSTDVGRPPPNATEGIGTTYQIRASNFEPDVAGENVRFRAIVEPGGIVMSYELRYELIRNGTRVTVREELRHQTVLFESFTERG
jgi:hypothetical protein